MKRALLLGSILLGVVLAAALHPEYVTPDEAAQNQDNPASSVLTGTALHPIAHASTPATLDSLGEDEALRAISDLYQLQSDLLAAQAESNETAAQQLLDEAVTTIDALTARPDIAQHPQFRALYQSLSAEYETQYGVPDTLELPEGEIHDIRRDLFASVNRAAAGPLLEDVPAVNPSELDTEIPMTVNDRVRASMAHLLERPERHLYPWMRRSATYFPMIEHILAEEGVPDELKYLAVVESGLNPNAVSHMQAVGMWQFMTHTAQLYDLTINPWVDERRDPEKSTRTAARHLRDLYELFGDWKLALASYNANPSLVRQAVQQAERRLDRPATYWDIYDDIPEETRNYVPTFIATALIMSNPTAFDLDRVEPGPRYAYDYAPVEGMLSLDTVADMVDASPDAIKALNPELRQDRLPPAQDAYYVRLPYGTYESFAHGYAELPDEEKPRVATHTVRAGESIGQIAQRYDVSRQDLLAKNDLRAGVVESGQTLKIPTPRYGGNTEVLETAEGEPMHVRYGARMTRPIASSDLPSTLEGMP